MEERRAFTKREEAKKAGMGKRKIWTIGGRRGWTNREEIGEEKVNSRKERRGNFHECTHSHLLFHCLIMMTVTKATSKNQVNELA
jgi:hypothetical protein